MKPEPWTGALLRYAVYSISGVCGVVVVLLLTIVGVQYRKSENAKKAREAEREERRRRRREEEEGGDGSSGGSEEGISGISRERGETENDTSSSTEAIVVSSAVEEGDEAFETQENDNDNALWSGTNKNQDVSTGSLARPFVRLLALLTRSLAPDCSLRSRPPLRSPVRSLAHFAHSLARGKVNF